MLERVQAAGIAIAFAILRAVSAAWDWLILEKTFGRRWKERARPKEHEVTIDRMHTMKGFLHRTKQKGDTHDD